MHFEVLVLEVTLGFINGNQDLDYQDQNLVPKWTYGSSTLDINLLDKIKLFEKSFSKAKESYCLCFIIAFYRLNIALITVVLIQNFPWNQWIIIVQLDYQVNLSDIQQIGFKYCNFFITEINHNSKPFGQKVNDDNLK